MVAGNLGLEGLARKKGVAVGNCWKGVSRRDARMSDPYFLSVPQNQHKLRYPTLSSMGGLPWLTSIFLHMLFLC